MMTALQIPSYLFGVVNIHQGIFISKYFIKFKLTQSSSSSGNQSVRHMSSFLLGWFWLIAST
jgi:hypothetical protein